MILVLCKCITKCLNSWEKARRRNPRTSALESPAMGAKVQLRHHRPRKRRELAIAEAQTTTCRVDNTTMTQTTTLY